MLSDNIRKYRKLNQMSQDELADKLEVTRQSISLWETGQTQPTIDNVIALSKIFNISPDALLTSDGSTEIGSTANNAQVSSSKKKNKLWLYIAIIAVAIIGIVLTVLLLGGRNNNDYTDATDGLNTSQAETKENDNATNETTAPAVYTTSPSTEEKQVEEAFDLFTYCKNFAIEKGELNGDYSIYQQPSTLYGGFENEYFSISYWGDSDMVEFCLHCPLSETQSINFYLRMRGGYDGKYEYLTSKYYRDTGESLRSATGYIDPAVFSEKYPLSCDEYYGSTDGQTDFMEESRVGICDVIKCLKKFVEVEKMDCDFSDFEFVNF